METSLDYDIHAIQLSNDYLTQNKVEIYEKLVFNRSSLVVIASITADL